MYKRLSSDENLNRGFLCSMFDEGPPHIKYCRLFSSCSPHPLLARSRRGVKFRKSCHLGEKSKKLRWPYLVKGLSANKKLIGFGRGAAPRAQIRGVFVCRQPLHEISRCEDLFTAEQVLHLFGALPRVRPPPLRPPHPSFLASEDIHKLHRISPPEGGSHRIGSPLLLRPPPSPKGPAAGLYVGTVGDGQVTSPVLNPDSELNKS